ncbi:unnamed protein product [Gemmata massiliana]|uniref:Uncharacterized protein n=1 Tax=Gemmata massiliana TaxID=1210884 RepID=A0A6P2DAM0_9BACT|nr:unnamed protein product [Gemmata massiliana]
MPRGAPEPGTGRAVGHRTDVAADPVPGTESGGPPVAGTQATRRGQSTVPDHRRGAEVRRALVPRVDRTRSTPAFRSVNTFQLVTLLELTSGCLDGVIVCTHGGGTMNPIPKSFGTQEFGDVDWRRAARAPARGPGVCVLGGSGPSTPEQAPRSRRFPGRVAPAPEPARHAPRGTRSAPRTGPRPIRARSSWSTTPRTWTSPGTGPGPHNSDPLVTGARAPVPQQLGHRFGNRGDPGGSPTAPRAAPRGRTRPARPSAHGRPGEPPVGPGSRRTRGAPATNRWVHIADRGADAFEFVSRLVRTGERFVGRAPRPVLGPRAKRFATVGATEGRAVGNGSSPPRPRAGPKSVGASATGVTIPHRTTGRGNTRRSRSGCTW